MSERNFIITGDVVDADKKDVYKSEKEREKEIEEIEEREKERKEE